MNRIKSMWNNYAEQFPHRWQWWVSGLIYGIFFGKLYAEIKQTREQWDAITFETFTWTDAAVLVFDLKFDFDMNDDQITMWLLNRGYTFPATHDLPNENPSQFGDLTTEHSVIARLVRDRLNSVDCGPGDDKCVDDGRRVAFCQNHHEVVIKP